MTLKPITLAEANQFVACYHRHNRPVRGHRFSIGLFCEGELRGVAILGRPVSRVLDTGLIAEITRLCVHEAPKGACSKLYRACARAWGAMGGKEVVTYTLASESGASLRGAGFTLTGKVKVEKGWSRAARLREWQPVLGQQKFRWSLSL